uniref:Innexin n=1 Tax=Strigamia maritima TaxID=126957 RepID=T1J998_STRMM
MSILASFSSLALNTSARIDNFIFHLHYRVTAPILAAAAILITSREQFGKPISCGPPPPSLTTELLENYCWTKSTFALDTAITNNKQNVTFHHTYYQWVWLVLILQAIMFYLPHYIWKTIDNQRISHIVKGLTDPMSEKDSMNAKISILGQYLLRNWNKLNKWAYVYVMCEILNFLNVIAQIYVIDVFLGGIFTTYGLRVLEYGFFEEEYRNDTIGVVFPRLTKCVFSGFGASANFQVHDAICVLPVNIINEKIYICLWFWLVLLAIPSGGVLLYRIVVVSWPKLRVKMLHWQYDCFRSHRMDHMLRRAEFGDWLFLNLLAKNVDALALDMLLDELEVVLSTQDIYEQ